jgi:hypothetical protein
MKTAVEELADKLKKNHGIDLRLYDEFQQAKETEKQQIIDAHLDGQSLVSCKDEYAEQYYNETFKSE